MQPTKYMVDVAALRAWLQRHTDPLFWNLPEEGDVDLRRIVAGCPRGYILVDVGVCLYGSEPQEVLLPELRHRTLQRVLDAWKGYPEHTHALGLKTATPEGAWQILVELERAADKSRRRVNYLRALTMNAGRVFASGTTPRLVAYSAYTVAQFLGFQEAASEHAQCVDDVVKSFPDFASRWALAIKAQQ